MLCNKLVREFLKPALAKVLEVYLKMVSDIDSEQLYSSFEKIMATFRDDMGPYAVQIATQLVSQYQKLVQVDVDEDDGEAALAAAGCVQAIRRLVEAITKDADMIDKLRDVIFPVLMHSLSIDGLDAIEDGLDIIAICLYYGKNSVSEEMWKLYP